MPRRRWKPIRRLLGTLQKSLGTITASLGTKENSRNRANYFKINGEPGGARTRDHRIKSAPRALLSAPTCTLAESFRIGCAGECNAFRQNGERHGGRRGFNLNRRIVAIPESVNKKTPFLLGYL